MSTTTTCLGVIPVRLESSRFPNKPLKDIHGKTLVERVWLQAGQSSCVTTLVVATNNEEIAAECTKKGMRHIMTSASHETGTDRVAEACAILEKQGHSFDLVANIQGDMPFVNPTVIDSVITSLARSESEFGMATIGTPITSREEFERPASVKIALGESGRALYFSRSAVPHWRNFPGDSAISAESPLGYKHMGLYIFRRETLAQIATLPKAFTEQREALEQLRALAHGIAIKVHIVSRESVEPCIEVDTPEDLEQAIRFAALKNL
ncbi:MAG: putative 3-deoxy-manno-octulosonate cytidylyltransferase [Pseudomonadota bacterium]|jgi:3-deoxy-manno-octulosonate cytidylyltransferase (CMP-KDO synthetase)